MPRKFHQSKKAVEPDRQENLFDYDYEIMKNNVKKTIILIENTYSTQILNELKSLYA